MSRIDEQSARLVRERSEQEKKESSLWSFYNAVFDSLNEKIKTELRNLAYHSSCHYRHSLEVTWLANYLGTMLDLSDDEIMLLTQSAFVHDLGKVYVKKEILEKPDKLDDDEFVTMKKHVGRTIEILNKCGARDLAAIAGYHHEFKVDIKKRYRRSGIDRRKVSRLEKGTGGRRLGDSGKPQDIIKVKRNRKLGQLVAIADMVQAVADNNRSYHLEQKDKNQVLAIVLLELGFKSQKTLALVSLLINIMNQSGRYFVAEFGGDKVKIFHNIELKFAGKKY